MITSNIILICVCKNEFYNTYLQNVLTDLANGSIIKEKII